MKHWPLKLSYERHVTNIPVFSKMVKYHIISYKYLKYFLHNLHKIIYLKHIQLYKLLHALHE